MSLAIRCQAVTPDPLAAVLELRPNCEHCNADLPHDAANAMICSYECTFCDDCVTNELGGKCPNCGGNLERRPTRIAAAP